MNTVLCSSVALLSLLAPRAHSAVRWVEPVKGDDPKPEDIRAGNDLKKRYLLHVPDKRVKEPAGGWRVLVVMPGGDGSAEFAPFVGNVRAKSLGDEWLIAQMVAPKWDTEQEQVLVWPTEKNPYKGMKFSTEKFFDAVLEDLGKRKKIDPRYVFTLTWSSSGMPAYALSLEPKTRITGSFVAMSVFKPDQLPPLKAASGRAYYLFHSEQDKTVPIRMSESARDALAKAGANVVLENYEGGHGWHGNVFEDIQRGIDWLEEKQAKPAKTKADK